MFREAINRPGELRGFGSRRQAESRRWLHGEVACLLRTGSRQKRRHEVDCYQGLAHPFGKRRCEVDCYRWLTLLPKSVATRSIAARRWRFLSKASCSHRFGTRNSASDGKRHSSSRASGEQCFCQEASLDMHERPGGTLPVKGVVLAERAVRTDPNRISGSPIRTQRRLRPTRTHALMGSPILAACTCRTGPPRAAMSLMCQVSSLRSLRHRRATAGRM
jgi:hypothetical protein